MTNKLKFTSLAGLFFRRSCLRFLHILNYRSNPFYLLLHLQYYESCSGNIEQTTQPHAKQNIVSQLHTPFHIVCHTHAPICVLLLEWGAYKNFHFQPIYLMILTDFTRNTSCQIRFELPLNHYLWVVMDVVFHKPLGHNPLTDCPQTVVPDECPRLGAGKLSARKIEVIMEAVHTGGIGTSALRDVRFILLHKLGHHSEQCFLQWEGAHWLEAETHQQVSFFIQQVTYLVVGR